jgi:hypothetical protein
MHSMTLGHLIVSTRKQVATVFTPVILATGVIAAPIVHRLLHRFHLELEKE